VNMGVLPVALRPVKRPGRNLVPCSLVARWSGTVRLAAPRRSYVQKDG